MQSFLAATSTDSDIDVPCAFVVPMFDTATAASGLGSTTQNITERFAIIVCADNSQDKRFGRGMAAETILKTARSQLFNALLAWVSPDQMNMDPIQYARGQHLFMNNARIWHQFEWTASYLIAGDPSAVPNATQYAAIQAIIMANWPDANLDPTTIQQIFVQQEPSINGSTEGVGPGSYAEILHVFTDQTPPWIRKVERDQVPVDTSSIVDGPLPVPQAPTDKSFEYLLVPGKTERRP